MPDPVPTPPASPTGTPLIPPKVFGWLAMAVSAALAALGALLAFYPDSKALQVALAVLTAVAAVLGIASPGLRRAAVVLLAVGSTLTLSACPLKPAIRDELVDKCLGGFVTSEINAVLPEVAGALQGRTADWQAQLDGVLLRGGEAAICALVVLLQSLEGGTGGSPGAMPVVLLAPSEGGVPPAVMLLRGYSYLEARR